VIVLGIASAVIHTGRLAVEQAHGHRDEAPVLIHCIQLVPGRGVRNAILLVEKAIFTPGKKLRDTISLADEVHLGLCDTMPRNSPDSTIATISS
jgi:hypothetical protein